MTCRVAPPARESHSPVRSVRRSRELARWFANAECVLTEAAANYPSATAVRCWPHHFDIGFLVLLEAGRRPGNGGERGESACRRGDSSYPQPYFYVNPYPRPEDPPEAELAGGGHWHSEGFFGAVLLGEKVTEDDSAEAQGSRGKELHTIRPGRTHRHVSRVKGKEQGIYGELT